MNLRVQVDETKCVASGQCVMTAPDVFDQRDEDGVAVLVQERPGPELEGEVAEAAALCPAAAIRVIEE